MAVRLNLIFLLTGISYTLKKHTNDSESDPLVKLCFVNIFYSQNARPLSAQENVQNIGKKLLTGAIVNESWMDV